MAWMSWPSFAITALNKNNKWKKMYFIYFFCFQFSHFLSHVFAQFWILYFTPVQLNFLFLSSCFSTGNNSSVKIIFNFKTIYKIIVVKSDIFCHFDSKEFRLSDRPIKIYRSERYEKSFLLKDISIFSNWSAIELNRKFNLRYGIWLFRHPLFDVCRYPCSRGRHTTFCTWFTCHMSLDDEWFSLTIVIE